MLRKTLTLGMVFILALSLLAVSMITCFTYEAEAHDQYFCRLRADRKVTRVFQVLPDLEVWKCKVMSHHHTGE